MKNIDVRVLISNNGLKYKDIADEMNISPEWLSRLMRYELSTENRIRVLTAIARLKGDDEK